ncbi:hypothetical protein D3C78_729730 [compost metagenome]
MALTQQTDVRAFVSSYAMTMENDRGQAPRANLLQHTAVIFAGNDERHPPGLAVEGERVAL